MKTGWGAGIDMTTTTRTMISALLIGALAAPAGAHQYYLYSPKPVTKDISYTAKDGVLVKDVPVERGDTLFDISRRLNGRGSYYPQILVFNEMKNPNLIHPGDVLKVPVRSFAAGERLASAAVPAAATSARSPQPSAAEPVTDISISDLKRHETKKAKRPAPAKRKTPAAQPSTESKPASEVQATPPSQPSAEQQLYGQALSAFSKEDFRGAITRFERFLAEYPSSALAPDAALYKAESYMKLSR